MVNSTFNKGFDRNVWGKWNIFLRSTDICCTNFLKFMLLKKSGVIKVNVRATESYYVIIAFIHFYEIIE